MKFPAALDFLNSFGMSPVETEPSMAYSRYVKRSEDESQELSFSFSDVEESFQVALKFKGVEVVLISSEMARSIEIVNDKSGQYIKVVFELGEALSEAIIKFDPVLHCSWWVLRK